MAYECMRSSARTFKSKISVQVFDDSTRPCPPSILYAQEIRLMEALPNGAVETASIAWLSSSGIAGWLGRKGVRCSATQIGLKFEGKHRFLKQIGYITYPTPGPPPPWGLRRSKINDIESYHRKFTTQIAKVGTYALTSSDARKDEIHNSPSK